MMEGTWRVGPDERGHTSILAPDGKSLGNRPGDALIQDVVRACNNHYELVDALEEIKNIAHGAYERAYTADEGATKIIRICDAVLASVNDKVTTAFSGKRIRR